MRSSNYHNEGFFTNYREFSGTILSSANNVKSYLELKKENNALLIENRNLRDRLFSGQRMSTNNVQMINDTVYKQQYYYREAKVVDYSLNRKVNYLVINRGSAQGVRSEMGVISASGVVGVVKDVSENFATVISLLNDDKLSFYGVLPRSGYSGRVSWKSNNIDELNLFEVPKNSPLTIGDSVLTGRASSIFPEGIPIGYIKEMEERQGETYYSILLNTAVNFSTLNNVYVIGNVYKQEQDKLKKEFIHTFNTLD